MAILPLIQRDHNIHISLNKHWWCVLCRLFQLPLSKEDDNSSCWMSPRWAIFWFDSRWLPICLASLRANASSVHDMPQMESFPACFSFPCLVNNSLRASSPVWANETSRARTRERASSSRVPLAHLLFTISPKWRAGSQAIVCTTIVSPFHSHGSCFQLRSH